MTTDTAIVPTASQGRTAGDMAIRLDDAKQRLAIVKEFFRDVMVKDEDYGVIPGTLKPTLLKPGAEKLTEFYGYAPVLKDTRETVDAATGFFRCVIIMALVSRKDGDTVAEGIGEANTMEGRYRWRTATKACPTCGAAAIIKGKAEYGGGWVCFAKKSGCGAKFKDGDPIIESQPSGRIENDDPWSLWNTVTKMAKKRALVDATLSATRSSGLFTQDMEDIEGWMTTSDGVEVSNPPKPAASQQSPQQRSAAVAPADGRKTQGAANPKQRAVNLRAAAKEIGGEWYASLELELHEKWPDVFDENGVATLSAASATVATEIGDFIAEQTARAAEVQSKQEQPV